MDYDKIVNFGRVKTTTLKKIAFSPSNASNTNRSKAKIELYLRKTEKTL